MRHIHGQLAAAAAGAAAHMLHSLSHILVLPAAAISTSCRAAISSSGSSRRPTSTLMEKVDLPSSVESCLHTYTKWIGRPRRVCRQHRGRIRQYACVQKHDLDMHICTFTGRVHAFHMHRSCVLRTEPAAPYQRCPVGSQIKLLHQCTH